MLEAYEAKEARLGPEMMRELERFVTLQVVNMRWIDHLAAMEDLEEGIGLRGYSGVDPLILYQKESYEYWLNLLATVREDIIRYIFRVEFQEAPPVTVATPHGQPVEFEDRMAWCPRTGVAGAAPAARPQPARQSPMARRAANDGPKVGRNDPCPCGSGLKYKKCCGRGK